MASTLSSIGFVFEDEAEFTAAMVGLAGEARERLPVEGGEYAIWRSRTGAEIWFQFAPGTEGADEIIGLTPFFEGMSEIPVKVTGLVRRPDDTPLEGAFMAWIAPDQAASGSEGSYPLVFDAVDFAAHGTRPLPEVRRVRLTGFAREISAFASEEAYKDRTPPPTFPARSIVSMGMITAAVEGRESDKLPPSSLFMLSGVVRGAGILTNEVTGRGFFWLVVESVDATFDILADPEVVTGDIVQGGTVQVTCVLIGRFLD